MSTAAVHGGHRTPNPQHVTTAAVSTAAVQAGDAVITFLPRAGKVYDTKPRLTLRGKEFGQLSTEDMLHLEFSPPMSANGEKQFEATLQADDAILLELAPGKR